MSKTIKNNPNKYIKTGTKVVPLKGNNSLTIPLITSPTYVTFTDSGGENVSFSFEDIKFLREELDNYKERCHTLETRLKTLERVTAKLARSKRVMLGDHPFDGNDKSKSK